MAKTANGVVRVKSAKYFDRRGDTNAAAVQPISQAAVNIDRSKAMLPAKRRKKEVFK